MSSSSASTDVVAVVRPATKGGKDLVIMLVVAVVMVGGWELIGYIWNALEILLM
jgi:hypothetical protein